MAKKNDPIPEAPEQTYAEKPQEATQEPTQEPTQAGTTLAVYKSDDEGLMPTGGFSAGNVASIFTPQQFAVWTSLNQDNPEKILLAMQDADYSLIDYMDEHPGAVLLLQDVLIHNIQLTDEETGELKTEPRTVLIDVDGKRYASVSRGVIGSLQKIFPLFGIPPYDPPMAITARRVKTRKFKTININVVGSDVTN